MWVNEISGPVSATMSCRPSTCQLITQIVQVGLNHGYPDQAEIQQEVGAIHPTQLCRLPRGQTSKLEELGAEEKPHLLCYGRLRAKRLGYLQREL